MKLQEIFDQLTYGELSQLGIGGGEAGAISEAHYAQVIAHVNLGLLALYKRFALKEGRITLDLKPGLTTYPLNSEYADDLSYIRENSDAPFADDVLKIERVYTAAGFELSLNDLSNPYSLKTPSSQVLQVPASIVTGGPDLPDVLKTATLDVVYRARHPVIPGKRAHLNPNRVEVELPDTHLWALLLFIASRVHNPTGMSNEMQAGSNYMTLYEAECQRLVNENVQIDQGSQNTRLERGGWV